VLFRSEALHIDLFERLRDDPESYINGILRHIGAAGPWSLPTEFMQKKVHATNSLIEHTPKIPEVVEWYIASRLLESTERLNEVLEGRVSSWVNEMRTIRGKTRLSWQILKEVNRAVLSVPERVAYEAYHAVLDARLWSRWQRLQRSYACGTSNNCERRAGSRIKFKE